MSSSVRGPTSALSSFLREFGIQPRGHRFQRAQQPTQTEELPDTTTTSTNNNNDNDNQHQSHDDRDENEDSLEEPMNLTVEIHNRRQTKTRTKQEKKKFKKDDNEPIEKESKGKQAWREADTLICNRCSSHFVPSSRSQSTSLCSPCLKLSTETLPISSSSSSSLRGKGRKSTKGGGTGKEIQTVYEKVLVDEFNRKLIPLRDLCIRYISKYIASVDDDALLFVSDYVRDKICQIICKHRQLDNSTVKIFCGTQVSTLRLYDCAYLDTDGFEYIAATCPFLCELVLKECGQITNECALKLVSSFPRLQRVLLCGAYLIKDDTLSAFIASCSELESFEIEFSAKVGVQTCTALARCLNLSKVAFRHCSKIRGCDLGVFLSEECVSKLSSFEVSACPLVKEEDIIALLAKYGRTLESLCLTNVEISDLTLKHISEECVDLRYLSLVEAKNISNEAVGELGMALESLESVDISKCFHLTNDGIEGLVCKPSLKRVNLNGLKNLTPSVILKMIETCEKIEFADFSWIHDFDDDCLLNLLEKRISNSNHLHLVDSNDLL